jgi:hypothetical protein
MPPGLQVSRVCYNILLLIFAPCISSDVVVDVVCLMPLSAFPVSGYDSVLQQVAGIKLGAPTSLRPDLITGAAARNMYFPDNTSILRFQLLHVTRAHSILLFSGGDSASIVQIIRVELVKAIASKNMGVCGVDVVSDTSTLTVVDGAKSWLADMPDSLVLVALVGWFVTLVFCGGAWIYYVFYTTNTPSADVVVVKGQDTPATAAIPTAMVSSTQSISLLPTVKPSDISPPNSQPFTNPSGSGVQTVTDGGPWNANGLGSFRSVGNGDRDFTGKAKKGTANNGL